MGRGERGVGDGGETRDEMRDDNSVGRERGEGGRGEGRNGRTNEGGGRRNEEREGGKFIRRNE